VGTVRPSQASLVAPAEFGALTILVVFFFASGLKIPLAGKSYSNLLLPCSPVSQICDFVKAKQDPLAFFFF
jgi:hypothetical protein